ncbi:glypican 5 [Rhinolophus ferrumequinum]|uniref:Glypican 5 n=1 Tax=Rhinolophus ferrumequinum TaxID=59479 RepID=A0A7J7ZQ50_RHIFE|nr:glypican 5 [Rhinolophus ferrumequinum]
MQIIAPFGCKTSPIIYYHFSRFDFSCRLDLLLQGRSPKPEKWELQMGSGGGMAEQVSGDCDDEDGCGASGSGEVKRTLKVTDWMPDEMNLSDVKQIHQTDGGSTLDTTGSGSTAATESMTVTLMGAVMLLPTLW